MTIYSGFANRQQQKTYDQTIYNVISTLLVRIIKFYKHQDIDEKMFKKIIKQQHKILSKMEKRKYLDPKYADLLMHFIKQFNQQQQQFFHNDNSHQQFQLRRKSIEEGEGFNRTLSVLGKEINQLKIYTDKIDTLDIDELSSDRGAILEKIPEKKQSVNHKKKKSKSRNTSIKSNIDLWDMRKEKLPEIPMLHHPIQQNIMNKTRMKSKSSFIQDYSEKIMDRTLDDQSLIDQDLPSQKGRALRQPPKFRAKMFFK